MDVAIRKSDIIDFEFRAPPSKSFTHRAFTIATLGNGLSRIENPLLAGDTESTLKACKAFGAKIAKKKKEIHITGTGGRLKTPAREIDVGNSGTTIRFFTSLAALNGKVTLTGDSSIQKRPMQPLLDSLESLGANVKSIGRNGRPPIEVFGGGIRGGGSVIRGDISSQFISSILISAPYALEPVQLDISTPLKSKPYVDVTLKVMSKFGIRVENQNYESFRVPQGVYQAKDYSIEGDYSSSSYLLSLAALSGARAIVENLSRRSVQGDKIILEILRQMGAKVRHRKDHIIVEGGSLKGTDIGLGDTPDLLPTVTALACAAKGKTRIYDVEHARLKESDRVSACAREFSKFGAEIKESKGSLMISGSKKLTGRKVNSYGDHRMVMSLAIMGAIASGETIIKDAESVNISFPEFFKILQKTGVESEILK